MKNSRFIIARCIFKIVFKVTNKIYFLTEFFLFIFNFAGFFFRLLSNLKVRVMTRK